MIRYFFLLPLLLLAFSACTTRPTIVQHPSRQKSPPTQPGSTSNTNINSNTKPTTPPTGAGAQSANSAGPQPSAPPIINRPSSPSTAQNFSWSDSGLSAPLIELKKNIAETSKAQSLIDSELSLDDLELAANHSSFTPLRPEILMRLGRAHQHRQSSSNAIEYYRALATQYPQSPLVEPALAGLAAIQNPPETDARVIGAILPITGRNASLGQHALNALRLGLEMSKNSGRFRIAVYDSQSSADSATKAVDKLVREDRAIALIGGFTAKEASSIALRADLYGVPYLGFSQKSGLTSIGPAIFRNAVTPEMQVDRLVQYCFDKLSAKKFAIVYPNDNYGVEFSNIFWDHVLARGGEVTAAQIYDPKENDFSEVIQKLLSTYHIDARQEEYQTRLREIKSKRAGQPRGNSRDHWAEENVLTPIVDFDVVFVPDTSRALGQILAFMKYNEVGRLNYVGTNIWNSPELPARVGNLDSGFYFVDAIDSSQEAAADYLSFKQEYLKLYGEEPGLVEIQVFEVGRLLREQLLAGVNTRMELAENLRILGRRPGITGELRMSNQRELERPLNIMSLEQGLIKKIE